MEHIQYKWYKKIARSSLDGVKQIRVSPPHVFGTLKIDKLRYVDVKPRDFGSEYNAISSQ